MKYMKTLWQLVSYLFWPQQGKQRRKMELLKKDITYLIGKERAEGNLEPITPLYVSRVLNRGSSERRVKLV